MTPKALARLVATLYTASGRHYGEVELEVFATALENVDDELGLLAGKRIIQSVDLGTRAPNPYLVLEQARAIKRAQQDATPRLPESTEPLLPVDENLRRLREVSERLRKKPA